MKKVLVIEDHPDMRGLIVRELEIMGFEPIAASDGKEGVEKAVSERPHLILLDVLMPEMDGLEAARILRANPETKDIPIIAETALSQPSHLNNCLRAGCNDCLIKPFTYDDLKEKVRAFI